MHIHSSLTSRAPNERLMCHKAWEWQTAQVRARLDAETGAAARSCDAALLVQHPPVYTLGRGSLTAHLHFHPSNPPPGSDCVRTDRGGEATFHGPGQLVLYPILDLNYHGRDIHEYMRLLEELVIVSLKDCCGIEAGRMEGLTGVWVDDEKVAAVGVGMRRWISYHGVALNVCTDLEAFNRIVPCGISDRGVCSVQSILGEDACPDIGAVASSMKNAFAAVFGLSLVEKSAEGVPR